MHIIGIFKIIAPIKFLTKQLESLCMKQTYLNQQQEGQKSGLKNTGIGK
jgi:hypothetical protein